MPNYDLTSSRPAFSMPPLQILFLVFLLVPLVEIYLLIKVGSVIGAPWTIFLVVFTAVLGAWLVRAQGIATLGRFQDAVRRGELPAEQLFDGLCLLVAGALLLTPGFVTDAFGFACLTPALRRAALRRLIERGTLRMRPAGAGPSRPRETLDGEYRRIDP